MILVKKFQWNRSRCPTEKSRESNETYVSLEDRIEPTVGKDGFETPNKEDMLGYALYLDGKYFPKATIYPTKYSYHAKIEYRQRLGASPIQTTYGQINSRKITILR